MQFSKIYETYGVTHLTWLFTNKLEELEDILGNENPILEKRGSFNSNFQQYLSAKTALVLVFQGYCDIVSHNLETEDFTN